MRKALILPLMIGGLYVLSNSGCNNSVDPNLITASGHMEATDVQISTKIGGTLIHFPFQEGDSLTQGQELARIDTTDVNLQLQQAKAERSRAEAELSLRLEGSRKEDIAELEAKVAGAKADLEGAQKDLERMQALLDAGSGTNKARDDARTGRDVAAARLKALQESLARSKAGSRIQEIEASRAQLAAAEARIAQLEQQIKDAVIVSPLAGIITEKIAEQGELLQPGSPVCVITDLRNPWLNVYIGEPDLGRVRIGQEAEVITDDGQTRKGKVTFISPQAEFTPKNVQTREERVKLVYKIKIALPNEDGLFKPGMPAEARFHTEPKS